jgi:hypothetical protein
VKIYRSEQKKKFRKFPGDVGCGLARALLVTEISRKFICSVGAASAPHFTKKRNIQLMILYCANTICATSLVLLNLFFQNSPINWAVIHRNGNTMKKRWRRIKKTKDCQAPRSEANTL